MRKLLIFLLLIFFGSGLIYTYRQPLETTIHSIVYYSPCNTPIQYKIGQVDPQFNITTQQFTYDVGEAAGIWNSAEQKSLLLYASKGNLTINLIFDGRQQVSTQISNLNTQVQNEKNAIDPKIAEYNRLSQQFQTQLDQFKSEADYWNKKGGAPPDIYQQLVTEQKSLQDQANTLNALAKELNISTSQYNSNITQLNNTIQSYNQDLQFKPEEGVYDPKTNSITIYFNNSHAELIHTLTHELGHALGLQHNSNTRSIMYYQTSQTLLPTQEDITALQSVCQEEPIWTVLQRKLAAIMQTAPTQ